MSDRIKVLCCRGDRFGARLKNLLCALHFAEALGAELQIQWERKDPETGAGFEFEGFFDPSVLDVFESLQSVLNMHWRDASAQFAPGQCEWITEIGPQTRNYFLDHPDRGILFDQTSIYEFTDVPKVDLNAVLRTLFSRIPFSVPIAIAIDDVLSQIDVTRALAVHIRRGDIVRIASECAVDLEGSSKVHHLRRHIPNFVTRYAPDEAYHSAIQSHDAGAALVLFSDDTTARSAFAKVYADRIIDVHTVLDRHDLTESQRAAAEFLVMSRCQSILCHKSQFSLLAAELGGAKVRPIMRHVRADDLFADLLGLVRGRADRDAVLEAFMEQYDTFLRWRRHVEEADKLRDLYGNHKAAHDPWA